MATGYTPGLTVSSNTEIRKLRRLPLKGKVLVNVGDVVHPDTVVAETSLPGMLQSLRIADRLGVAPSEAKELLKVETGNTVSRGDILAETKGLFGRFFRTEFRSPVEGTVEFFSPATGNLGIRESPTPVTRNAYIHGTVTEVIPQEGVVVSCLGALIQGIFGVGGERLGTISVTASAPGRPLHEDDLNESHQGKIVIGGTGVTPAALRKAANIGIEGMVLGGIVDRELMDYLAEVLNQPGYDIGVAITGQENIPYTLLVTEGFGNIQMSDRAFRLFQSLEGKLASINGATQIRAGVIRPEVIVPDIASQNLTVRHDSDNALEAGAAIRIIREPYFGQLATVATLPHALTQIESETWARVLTAKLPDGTEVTVPRANVELIQ